MPRWMAHLLVVVGWLLTPAWAWAASHVGLWLGALVALRFESPVVMLAIAGAGALVCGFAVLWTWVMAIGTSPSTRPVALSVPTRWRPGKAPAEA